MAEGRRIEIKRGALELIRGVHAPLAKTLEESHLDAVSGVHSVLKREKAEGRAPRFMAGVLHAAIESNPELNRTRIRWVANQLREIFAAHHQNNYHFTKLAEKLREEFARGTFRNAESNALKTALELAKAGYDADEIMLHTNVEAETARHF